jgi:hypothetical protein
VTTTDSRSALDELAVDLNSPFSQYVVAVAQPVCALVDDVGAEGREEDGEKWQEDEQRHPSSAASTGHHS